MCLLFAITGASRHAITLDAFPRRHYDDIYAASQPPAPASRARLLLLRVRRIFTGVAYCRMFI